MQYDFKSNEDKILKARERVLSRRAEIVRKQELDRDQRVTELQQKVIETADFTLQWTEKYPKDYFDRYQKAIKDWLDALRTLPKDKAPFIVDPIEDNLRYPEKLPNACVSGSFISRAIIKANQRELDQKNQVWLLNPKHHAPIGGRYVGIYRNRVSDSWTDMFKTTRDLWNKIRESGELPDPKAYLKKNQRGKPIIAKKKDKPSGLLKALIAKKD